LLPLLQLSVHGKIAHLLHRCCTDCTKIANAKINCTKQKAEGATTELQISSVSDLQFAMIKQKTGLQINHITALTK
jgi:hypothetical protein